MLKETASIWSSSRDEKSTRDLSVGPDTSSPVYPGATPMLTCSK
jgi:hypothetical protein